MLNALAQEALIKIYGKWSFYDICFEIQRVVVDIDIVASMFY